MRKCYVIFTTFVILPIILNMQIYKYQTNNCLKIESGRYFDANGISVGFNKQKIFGSTSPSLNVDGYEEISEQQLMAYAKTLDIKKDGIELSLTEKELVIAQLLEDKKKQFGEIVEAIPQPIGQFRGKNIYAKEDVQRIAGDDIANLFVVREGNPDKVGAQLKVASEVILILLAYQGKVSFSQCGIAGVMDTISADAYIDELYTNLWVQKTAIGLEAEQFIAANNLK